jgi:hypothetical protein
VGLVLKHSIDTRTEKRLKLDSDRNAVLQREAEQRLTLEAGIKAVQLLATATGDASPPIQQAGALFSLASLRQYDLAASLVFGLLEADQIDPGIAAGVLERVIQSQDVLLTENVLSNLASNAEKMLTKMGVSLPESLSNGPRGFSTYSRRKFPEIITRVLVARPLSEWNQEGQIGMAYTLIGSLCLCWLDETDPQLKANVGALLSAALPAFADYDQLYHHRETIFLEPIRKESATFDPQLVSQVAASLVKRVQAWTRGETPGVIAT